MADLRPFERSDLHAVTSLLRAQMPTWALNEDLLAATTLEHPWSDADLPSLVALGNRGEVIGFIASQVRRMQFDGRAIRGVCGSHLVVAPGHRAGAPGALLLSRLLSGPQDVTWSDSATDGVVRAWRISGGNVDYARAADFMLVLRPRRWVQTILSARARGEKVGRRLVPVGSFPVPATGRWLTGRSSPSRATGVEGEAAGAALIAEQMPTIDRRLRVRVAWDEQQLAHTFGLIAALNRGLTTRLVRRRGKPIGWYAYLLRPGGVSRVLHLTTSERAADAVLGELVDHATAGGSAVLAGRAEPHLEWSLRERLASLGFAWQPVIRARDPKLAAALATKDALLTRMDGELSTL